VVFEISRAWCLDSHSGVEGDVALGRHVLEVALGLQKFKVEGFGFRISDLGFRV
jgi:hypothetical protein